MRTKMIAALSMSLLAAGYTGCWDEPDVDIDVPGLECKDSVLPVVIQHDQVCPPEGCGTNTPHVHGIAFDGLYVNGESSDQGFRILGFRKGGDKGVISVNDGALLAVTAKEANLETINHCQSGRLGRRGNVQQQGWLARRHLHG